MNTPIYDFVKKYSDSGCIRLHMPGHKGKGLSCNSLSENMDITEIKGADSLFEANGIIKKSEDNVSKLFNTGKTIYSTGGSTLCIQTMLALAVQKKRSDNEKPLIVAVRNAHKAFLNSCILLDCEVKWVYPRYSSDCIASGEFSNKCISDAIDSCDRKPNAVYVTSPDYLGKMADIKGIAELCHNKGIVFIVDNAHGAYLRFLDEDCHPITLGADMCCDSAHKTLPVLTPGAYLHISTNAPHRFCDEAKDTMSLFATTSPSYLIMSSLDLCNSYLEERFKDELHIIVSKLNNLKSKLNALGLRVEKSDPLKLTINTAVCGLYGTQVADYLRKYSIECEYADSTYIVCMFTPYNTDNDINSLYKAFSIMKQPRIRLETPVYEPSQLIQAVSMRKAAFSESEIIDTDKSEGRICSKATVACPPGIPVTVSGEVIDKASIKILKKYSITKVNVIK